MSLENLSLNRKKRRKIETSGELELKNLDHFAWIILLFMISYKFFL